MTFNIFRFLVLFVTLTNTAMATDRITQADKVKSPVTPTNEVRVTNAMLFDVSGESLDWVNRRCKDPSNKFSLDWNNRITWDAAEITSIDWANRWLQSSAGPTIIDWESQTIYGADGTQALDWTDATAISGGQNIDQDPDEPSCCTGLTHFYLNSTIENSADVIYKGYTQADFSLRFDPGNTGFKIGNASGGGTSTFYLINATSDHISSGEMGGLTGVNVNLQFGDQANVITGGQANNALGIFNGMAQYDGHNIDGYTNYLANGSVDGTITTGNSFFIFNTGFNFGPTAGEFNYNGYSHGSQFENDFTSARNPQGFTNNWQFKNGSVAGFPTAFADYADIQSGSTLEGYQSLNLSPQFDSGSTINQNTTIAQVAPNGAGTFSNGLTILNVDGSSLSAVDPFSKIAINVQGGKSNFAFDADIPDATAAYTPFNFNTNLAVQSGSPISGSYGFGLNVSNLMNIQDDIGDDGLGGIKLGHSVIGVTGLMDIASGKTIDAYNGVTFGQAVISPSAGAINKFRAFRAVGFLPSGGTVTVADSVAFYSDSPFCSTATDCWTIFDGAGSENYLSKLAIGTSNNKVATAVKLEIRDGHIRSDQGTAPTTTVDGNAGTGATCTVSNATDTAGNVEIVTGSASTNPGVQCTVNFNVTYNTAPVCVISPTSANSTLYSPYVTTNTTGMIINFANNAGFSLNLPFSYHCVETN